jgi:hypothetical protein
MRCMHEEHVYACGHCGEEIVVTIDVSAGAEQEYVEDCPVCCHPHVLQVRIDREGHVDLASEPE